MTVGIVDPVPRLTTKFPPGGPGEGVKLGSCGAIVIPEKELTTSPVAVTSKVSPAIQARVVVGGFLRFA
jgi:hypothetical protein